MKCPICGETFEKYEDMRGPAYWCKPCQDTFDSIDWDEYVDRRLGN